MNIHYHKSDMRRFRNGMMYCWVCWIEQKWAKTFVDHQSNPLFWDIFNIQELG